MTDPDTAEIDDATSAPGHLAERAGRGPRSLLLMLLPIVPLVAAGVYILVAAGRSAETSAPSTAPVEVIDIGTVPTERLETILADARTNPEMADEVPGIALLLAERHFTDAAYDRAFSLYAEVIEHPRTRPRQFALSLSRVAWLAWLTNGDVDAALTTIGQSLSIDPGNAEAQYIKGQILWCGAGDAAAALELFETVLAASDLTDEIRTQVEGDARAAAAGQSCR